MMSGTNMNPYLFFNGRCAEAFRFYAQVLQGKLTAMMTFGESPECDELPPQSLERTMHACLEVGECVLMGSDTLSDTADKPAGMAVALAVEDIDTAERIFADLGHGGEVVMPMAETFWAHRFGMVVDRFGMSWMVNVLKPQA